MTDLWIHDTPHARPLEHDGCWAKVPVVKRTIGLVWIANTPAVRPYYAKKPNKHLTFDRERLEKDGCVQKNGTWFYTDAGRVRFEQKDDGRLEEYEAYVQALRDRVAKGSSVDEAFRTVPRPKDAEHAFWAARRIQEARKHAWCAGPQPQPRSRPLFQRETNFPTLHLTAPFTREAVQRAFRQHALRLHPDHGGDPAQFRALVAEKERALRSVATNEEAR